MATQKQGKMKKVLRPDLRKRRNDHRKDQHTAMTLHLVAAATDKYSTEVTPKNIIMATSLIIDQSGTVILNPKTQKAQTIILGGSYDNGTSLIQFQGREPTQEFTNAMILGMSKAVDSNGKFQVEFSGGKENYPPRLLIIDQDGKKIVMSYDQLQAALADTDKEPEELARTGS